MSKENLTKVAETHPNLMVRKIAEAMLHNDPRIIKELDGRYSELCNLILALKGKNLEKATKIIRILIGESDS